MSEAILDAHTHLFSRVFFETLATAAPGERPADERLDEVARQAGIELPGSDAKQLAARWLAEMDRAGIEAMVTFASVPQELQVVADVCRGSGGRLHGYVAVDPMAPGAGELVARALGELGLAGVVLFPALHRYDVGDERCKTVLEPLAAHAGVCVVHTGLLKIAIRDLLGIPRSYDARFASPLSVVRPASSYPGVRFVLPHFGGGLFREALMAGAWCENIFVDTSSSNAWLETQATATSLEQVFERALGVFGPERILFGTDSSTFPRGYRSDILEAQQAALDAIGVDDETRTRILGGNLKRLLGLG